MRVLDIFGFECFQQILLEQLCINYMNETLQQQFADMCSSSNRKNMSAKIKWSFVEFPDNQDCLDLIEGTREGVSAGRRVVRDVG